MGVVNLRFSSASLIQLHLTRAFRDCLPDRPVPDAGCEYLGHRTGGRRPCAALAREP